MAPTITGKPSFPESIPISYTLNQFCLNKCLQNLCIDLGFLMKQMTGIKISVVMTTLACFEMSVHSLVGGQEVRSYSDSAVALAVRPWSMRSLNSGSSTEAG